MQLSDLELEARIEDEGRKIIAAMGRGDKKQAQICFHAMAHLIGLRSAERIAQMEAHIFNAGTGTGAGSVVSPTADMPAPLTLGEEGRGDGR